PGDPRRLAPADLALGVGQGGTLHLAPGAVEGLEALEIVLAAPATVALAGTFGPELEVAVPSLHLRLDDLRHGAHVADAVLGLEDIRLRGGAEPAARFELQEARVRANSLPPWLAEI